MSWLAALCCAAAGCSSAPNAPAQPTYSAQLAMGFCGRTVILDAQGQLWREHGCEATSSTAHARPASAEELSSVKAAFATLPAPVPACQNSAPDGVQRVITHGSDEWNACDHDVNRAQIRQVFETLFDILDSDPDAGTPPLTP
ncbi:MAG TPA: hypothetical protein VH062_27410 [Polyangiaceae bacterium]|nr:hypothetical protein [Polyangiaceae bacterium]